MNHVNIFKYDYPAKIINRLQTANIDRHVKKKKEMFLRLEQK